MTTDETPIRDIGIEIDKRLHKRLGEIGDTYTLVGLAYLEGLEDKAIARRWMEAVFEKFQHLDRVLRECETADDPIYRTCAKLWVAVAEAQTANAASDLSRR